MKQCGVLKRIDYGLTNLGLIATVAFLAVKF